MANFFGSIPEPKQEYREVTYQWLPLWAYSLEEIEDIKMSCERYDFDTYTMLELLVQETSFYN
jgi:hypothetical protein